MTPETNYVLTASSLTGYIGGMAKWDESIPVPVRIRMLQYLIKVWSETDGDKSTLTQQWVADWKNEIEKLLELDSKAF